MAKRLSSQCRGFLKWSWWMGGLIINPRPAGCAHSGCWPPKTQRPIEDICYAQVLCCADAVGCYLCVTVTFSDMRSSGWDAVGEKYIWMLGNLVTFCSVAQEAQLAGEHFYCEKIIRAQVNTLATSWMIAPDKKEIQHESHILKTGPNTSFTNQTPYTFNFDRFINNKQSKVVLDQWLVRKMLSASFCLGILMYWEPEQQNMVSHGQLFSPKCSRYSEAWLA